MNHPLELTTYYLNTHQEWFLPFHGFAHDQSLLNPGHGPHWQV